MAKARTAPRTALADFIFEASLVILFRDDVRSCLPKPGAALYVVSMAEN
jgi:hypothetical protein